MPEDFSISKAYPNPFNPTVNIDFSISEESDINIQIFDLLGRNVFNHDQNFNTAGKYRFQWHGINDLGTPIASGVYFVTIQHKANIFKQKITFLK
jgi:flagellar hook assembly protein FlgD